MNQSIERDSTHGPQVFGHPRGLMTLFFSFGAAFEIPVATVLLVLTGITRVESLVTNRGYVLIGVFVIAAFLTPPDAISQCIMAVPMYLLYEAGIVMARLMTQKPTTTGA